MCCWNIGSRLKRSSTELVLELDGATDILPVVLQDCCARAAASSAALGDLEVKDLQHILSASLVFVVRRVSATTVWSNPQTLFPSHQVASACRRVAIAFSEGRDIWPTLPARATFFIRVVQQLEDWA